ncbi:MAG: hypothetical protein O9972_63280 [Burkholderiales bacterium]|nr:hypothetical protein [Burkholderiales bacterium]
MGGRSKESVDGSRFYNSARIHDGDTVCQLGDDPHIVSDKEHSHVKSVTKLAQEPQNLELNGDVERRRRFVGNEHMRPAGKRNGNHYTLPHPAGELVWEGRKLKPRIRYTNEFKELAGTDQRSLHGKVFTDPDSLRNLVADTTYWIQGSHRLLKDHRYRSVPHANALPRLGPGNIATAKCDSSRTHSRTRLRQKAHCG